MASTWKEIETMTAPQTLPQKITKSYVDKLSTPETGQAFIRDTELKGRIAS